MGGWSTLNNVSISKILRENASIGLVAVRLSFLEEFCRRHIDPSLTTAEVVSSIILPETASQRCRFVDLLDPKFVGPPEYFVSHRWGANFHSLLTAIQKHFEDDEDAGKRDVCVWLDIFAINQHPSQQQVDDLERLEQVIRLSSSTLLIIDGTGQVLRRVWCLFEIWKTVEYKGVENLIVVAKDVDILGLKDIFLQLSVVEAQATVESDRHRILSDIRATTGIEALNQFIRKALVDSARLEVDRLEPVKEEKSSTYFQAVDKAGQMMLLAGMYVEAEPMIKKSLDLCIRLGGQMNMQVASYHNILATLMKNQGKQVPAEFHQRKAVQISEEMSGDSAQTGTYLGNLAQLMQTMGRFGEAEPLLIRALDISRAKCVVQRTGKNLDVDDLDTAAILNTLASLYMDMDRPLDALPMYQRALSSVQAALSPQDPELTIYLANLAGVMQDLYRYKEAEELQRRAVGICDRSLGHQHPTTASVKSNLSEILGQQGKLREAEELAREALQVRRKVFGNDHPATGNSMNNLAGVLMERRNFAEAEPLLEEATALCERVLGPEHPVTANRLHNMATLKRDVGEMDEAVLLFDRSLKIKEKLYGPDHVDTLGTISNLAMVHFQREDLEKALSLFERCADYHRRLGPDGQPSLLTSLTNLAMVQHKAGRRTDAMAHMEEAYQLSKVLNKGLDVTAYQRKKGMDSLLAALPQLADILVDWQQNKEADELLRQTLELSEQVFGPEHPTTASGLHKLGVLLEDHGDLPQAIEMFSKCHSILYKVIGADHTSTLDNQARLAAAHGKAGQLEESTWHFQKVIDLYRRKGVEARPELLACITNLSMILHKAGKAAEAFECIEEAINIAMELYGSSAPEVAPYRRIKDALQGASASNAVLPTEIPAAAAVTKSNKTKVKKITKTGARIANAVSASTMLESSTATASSKVAHLWKQQHQLKAGNGTKAKGAVMNSDLFSLPDPALVKKLPPLITGSSSLILGASPRLSSSSVTAAGFTRTGSSNLLRTSSEDGLPGTAAAAAARQKKQGAAAAALLSSPANQALRPASRICTSGNFLMAGPGVKGASNEKLLPLSISRSASLSGLPALSALASTSKTSMVTEKTVMPNIHAKQQQQQLGSMTSLKTSATSLLHKSSTTIAPVPLYSPTRTSSSVLGTSTK